MAIPLPTKNLDNVHPAWRVTADYSADMRKYPPLKAEEQHALFSQLSELYGKIAHIIQRSAVGRALLENRVEDTLWLSQWDEKPNWEGIDGAVKLFGKTLFLKVRPSYEQACALRREIVAHNLGLVISVAKKYLYRCQHFTLSDLIQEGNIGLMCAVDRFSLKREGKLSTYARWWIRQSIQTAIAEKEGTIYLPPHVKEELREIRQKELEFRQKYGSYPLAQELADVLDWNVEKIHRLRLVRKRKIASTSEEITPGTGLTLERTLKSPQFLKPEDRISIRQNQEALQKAIRGLPLFEQRILQLRFGLKDGIAHGRGKIAMILATEGFRLYSREWIRKREVWALKELRSNTTIEMLFESQTT